MTNDVLEGLVKKNHEIAQQLDHSKQEAEFLKEERRRNDSVVFNNKIADQDLKILPSSLPNPTIPIKYTESCTTLEIKASDGAKNNTEASNIFKKLSWPVSMLQISPQDDSKSNFFEIFNYNQDTQDHKDQKKMEVQLLNEQQEAQNEP